MVLSVVTNSVPATDEDCQKAEKSVQGMKELLFKMQDLVLILYVCMRSFVLPR
jgi:hypothetical protein